MLPILKQFHLVLLATLVWSFFITSCWANMGDFGFGSRSAALGGATVAWGFDGYAAYANPAGLSALTANQKNRIVLSYGLVWLRPDFTPIRNVIVENDFVSDRVQGPRYGDVDTGYRDIFGHELGLCLNLLPEFHNLTAGVTVFLPFEQLSYIDSGEPFIPEYVLYRSRYQRPQAEIGLGGQISPRLHFGAGVHFSYSLTGTGNAFLQTDPERSSSLRMVATLKPKAAPYLGLLFTSKDAALNPVTSANTETLGSAPAGDWTLGLVFRFPVNGASNIGFNTSARAFGDSAAIDFIFNSSSSLFYDPLTVETGWSWQHSDLGRLFLQVDYQRWSKFESPALVVSPKQDNCDGVPCSPLSGSRYPQYEFQDIVIPRIGEEYALPWFVLRGGYAYRPSIMKGTPQGAGNYLDPPKHMINAGLGFKFKKFLGFEKPSNLDLHATYQALVSQKIEKTPGDELGRGSGAQKIGAPGYTAGGKIYGGGVSFTVAF